MRKLEVACFSAEDAKLALEHGADRIEFCADYSSGGITPDLDEFILLRSQFPEAKIHVIDRKSVV
jgi:copper homeostasis protein